jgi:hypothetical protein
MRALLKTNDAVMLSFAQSVLEEAGIQTIIFDTHASIMDGSMGMLPRRLMVADEDFPRAARLLREAIPDGPVEL